MKDQEDLFLDRLRDSRQIVTEAIRKLEALQIAPPSDKALDALEDLLFYIEDQIRNVKDEKRRDK